MFDEFMKNPYWRKIYEESSNELKEYYRIKFNCNGKKFDDKRLDEMEKIKDRFSKSDWEQLIAQSTGRAKYECTRMMNERFNEDGTPKIKKSTDLHDGKLSD